MSGPETAYIAGPPTTTSCPSTPVVERFSSRFVGTDGRHQHAVEAPRRVFVIVDVTRKARTKSCRNELSKPLTLYWSETTRLQCDLAGNEEIPGTTVFDAQGRQALI